MPERIVVVGLAGPRCLPGSLGQVDLVVGSARHFEILAGCSPIGAVPSARKVELGSEGVGLERALDLIGSEPGVVGVLASGDPGFFGVVRPLAERFGSGLLEVHPAPSSVSLAFAALGLSWDDAVVVSAHGRPLAEAARVAAGARKAAILTSPASPPEAVARALLDAGSPGPTATTIAGAGQTGRVVPGARQGAVCSQLGTPAARIVIGTLEELARGSFDPVSVVALYEKGDATAEASLAWDGAGQGGPDWGTGGEGPERSRVAIFARHESDFAHRGGMITKSEVRAVVLSRLALPDHGVLWDLGAGSGSVAIECALLSPGLRVLAVEDDPASAMRITANASNLGAAVEVVLGRAPEVLAALPRPDRVFVGGGGIFVLDAALGYLPKGGRTVATFTSWDRAQAGADRLGSVVRIATSRGEKSDGKWQLSDLNPVFVAWGPDEWPGTVTGMGPGEG